MSFIDKGVSYYLIAATFLETILMLSFLIIMPKYLTSKTLNLYLLILACKLAL